VARGATPTPFNQTVASIHNNGKRQGSESKYSKKTMDSTPSEAKTGIGPTTRFHPENPIIKYVKMHPTPRKLEVDHSR